MRRFSSVALLFSAVSCLTSGQASAGEILQDTRNDTIQVLFFGPIAQSFVAEDASVSFAYSFGVLNDFEPAGTLQLSLHEGEGNGGTNLGSFTFSLVDNFSGFFDVDLSAITLSVGQTYTAVLTASTGHFGVDVNLEGNPYAAGRGTFAAVIFGPVPTPNDDFRFRVTPGSSFVPTPSAWALFAVAAIGVAVRPRAAR